MSIVDGRAGRVVRVALAGAAMGSQAGGGLAQAAAGQMAGQMLGSEAAKLGESADRAKSMVRRPSRRSRPVRVQPGDSARSLGGPPRRSR